MNDFTKDELADLYHYTKRWHEFNDFHRSEKLLDKLQSLIDNYCKHETEMDRKNKIYREQILPRFGNEPNKVPPHMEPDYNEGWR